MILFDADDPLVLNGTYDREGYTPKERRAMAKRNVNDTKPTKDTKADPPKPRGRPRQQDLPGTEDRAIKPLEDVAAAYADVRDRCMALNQEEHELKAHALKLMHKFDKTIYRHNGIEIRIVEGEEDVKVKVKKAGDDEPADDGDEVAIEAEA